MTFDQPVHRNLGENGTGIRNINLTTTTLTPILQDRKVTPEEENDDPPEPVDTQDKSFNETLRNHNITSSRSVSIFNLICHI